MRLIPFVLLSLALASTACRTEKKEPPVARSGPSFMTDADGRALIFRGTNVESGAKSRPGHTISLTDDEIKMLGKEMGFNFVRYLVFWDGLEPQPGKYDEAYIDQIVGDIDRFVAAGMWVLVDVHQDVYAAKFCCDGAPDWAIRDDDLPFKLNPSWSLNYLQPAVKRAWDNFWAYKDGDHADLQDHYVAMLRHLATRLRTHPGVIGYDIMNEPHPGSYFDEFEVAMRTESELSPEFDKDYLHPFYQRAINAIREADTEKYVFFEARYGSPGDGSPSWIPPLVDPRDGDSRLVFAPHLYSFAMELNGVYTPEDPTIKLWEENRKKELERQNMPLVLGEWGLAYGTEDSERYVTELVEMTERMLMGSAHWSFDPSGPDGWSIYDRENKTFNPIFEIFDRPYPRVTAGEPTKLHFDADALKLTYAWKQVDGVTGETEVFVPMARENSGAFLVELSDAEGSWTHSWDEELPGLLRIKANEKTATHELVVRPAPR